MQVATFAVGGEDKKTELAEGTANEYTFTFTEDTTVVVTYEDIPAVTVADVTDIGILTAALANSNIETINITADITGITEALEVNHAVTTNGGDKTLSFTDALNTKLNGERQGILVYAFVDAGITEIAFTIKLVDADEEWGNVVYGEETLEISL